MASADQHSSLDLDDAIVPTGLDDLAVQTRWPQNATDNSLVEFESCQWRSEGHVQDSFGWLGRCFGHQVLLEMDLKLYEA